MSKRKVSEALKKQVAGKQRYKCATIPDYTCPMKGEPFDEAGYDIDHIIELRNGGSNDISNLQALCPACHRVKTSRNTAKIVVKPVEEHTETLHVKELNKLLIIFIVKSLINGRLIKIQGRS